MESNLARSHSKKFRTLMQLSINAGVAIHPCFLTIELRQFCAEHQTLNSYLGHTAWSNI